MGGVTEDQQARRGPPRFQEDLQFAAGEAGVGDAHRALLDDGLAGAVRGFLR